MSIISEITRLRTAKDSLKTSIEGKGVAVPSTATLDAYPTYVDSIQQGGGSSWAEIDTPSSTTLNRMTSYITSVDIPTNVTTIGNNAFNSCSSLTAVTIHSGVTSIGDSAFYSCTSLTSVTIPSGVTNIGDGAFSACSNLQSITIPSGVTSIKGNVFYNCSSLTSIDIPSGVTSIDVRAFQFCSSLQSITVNAVTPPTLGYNALGFTNDCPILVPSSSLEAYKAADGWSEYASRIQAIPTE